MEITVNGDRVTIEGMFVLDFLLMTEIDPARVAVELNLDILPKSDYSTTLLKHEDRLEIVQFVGGG
ncbi:MAG: sulfur carrier protein ThiS [Geobacteraceae bacterium]